MFDSLPPAPEPPAAPRAILRPLLGLLLAALTLASSALALGLWLRAVDVRESEEKLARSAETMAIAIEGALAPGLRALETLAGSRALDARELPAFREEARRLLAREPTWHTIALLEGTRQVLNLRHPAEGTPPQTDLPTGSHATRALPDGRILLRVPVQNDGAVRGALMAVLEATALAGPIARIGLPPRWSAVLMDEEGRLLAGGVSLERPAEALAPALAAPGRAQALAGGGQAMARRVGETGWAVVVVAPPGAVPEGALPILAVALVGAALAGAGLLAAIAALRRDRRGAERRAASMARSLAEQQRAAALSAALAPPPARLRLLVAEDVPASLMLLQSVLRRAGHEVVAVGDGAAAVAALRKGGFDLAVLDLHMPVMGGMAAAEAIRRMPGPGGGLPLIALTAEAPDAVEAACRAAGFDALLRKPCDSRRLLGMVETLRGRRPA